MKGNNGKTLDNLYDSYITNLLLHIEEDGEKEIMKKVTDANTFNQIKNYIYTLYKKYDIDNIDENSDNEIVNKDCIYSYL